MWVSLNWVMKLVHSLILNAIGNSVHWVIHWLLLTRLLRKLFFFQGVISLAHLRNNESIDHGWLHLLLNLVLLLLVGHCFETTLNVLLNILDLTHRGLKELLADLDGGLAHHSLLQLIDRVNRIQVVHDLLVRVEYLSLFDLLPKRSVPLLGHFVHKLIVLVDVALLRVVTQQILAWSFRRQVRPRQKPRINSIWNLLLILSHVVL